MTWPAHLFFSGRQMERCMCESPLMKEIKQSEKSGKRHRTYLENFHRWQKNNKCQRNPVFWRTCCAIHRSCKRSSSQKSGRRHRTYLVNVRRWQKNNNCQKNPVRLTNLLWSDVTKASAFRGTKQCLKESTIYAYANVYAISQVSAEASAVSLLTRWWGCASRGFEKVKEVAGLQEVKIASR